MAYFDPDATLYVPVKAVDYAGRSLYTWSCLRLIPGTLEPHVIYLL